MYSIGCDLHSKRMQLCLIDDDPAHEGYPLPEQAILLEEEVPATREALAEWVGKADREFSEPKEIAVETTGSWEWFVDAASLLVEKVHLVHARQAKAIAETKAKTDKLDARALAWLLKNDLVPEVYIPPLEARQLRDVFRHRTYMLKKRTGFKNRVHAMLDKWGVEKPPVSDLFGAGGRSFLSELDLAPPRELVIGHSLEAVDRLTERIAEVDDYLDEHPERPSTMVQRLKTTPGLAQRLSMHASLEIVDISRFPRAGKFVSYCSLAPGTDESAGTERPKGLMHGNKYLKWIYTVGASQAASHPYFRSTHQRQVAKNGRMIARLTVARKMARANYHMLKKGEDFLGGA